MAVHARLLAAVAAGPMPGECTFCRTKGRDKRRSRLCASMHSICCVCFEFRPCVFVVFLCICTCMHACVKSNVCVQKGEVFAA